MTLLVVNNEELEYKLIIKKAIAWGIGYALIWGTKWLIADIIYNENIINDGFSSIALRTSTENINLLKVFLNNIIYVCVEFILLLYISIICFIKYKSKKVNITKKEIVIYLAIAILPIVWFIFTQNHSFVHSLFTYRNLVITFIAIGVLDYKILIKNTQGGKHGRKQKKQ